MEKLKKLVFSRTQKYIQIQESIVNTKEEKEKTEGKFLDDFTKVFSIVASTLTTILLASRL